MNLIHKMICVTSAILFSTTAFALGVNRLDILGYGGYSQASEFSDAGAKDTYGTMTGFNGGAMLLVSLGHKMVSPVIGGGAQYMQLKSSITDPTNTFQTSNTLTSQAATGHLGLRVSAPLIRLFLLGNAGYGFSGDIKSDVTLVGSGAVSGTADEKMDNHVFYGGTAALLMSVAPFIKMGVSGVYNVHSLKLQDKAAVGPDTSTTYQEVSGNFVIDINL